MYKFSDIFWKYWREEYLKIFKLAENGQMNAQMTNRETLLREKNVERNEWLMGVIEAVVSGDDGLVGTVEVHVSKDGNISTYKRSVTEIVLLLDWNVFVSL